MRILLAIDVRWYNACADFALMQAQSLQKLGHEILLMADRDSPPARKARELQIPLNEDVRFSSFNIIASNRRFNKIIKEFTPDAIVAHRGESHLLGALAARKSGVPVIRFRGDVRKPRPDIFSKILNEKLTQGIAVSTEKLKHDYVSRYRLNGIPVGVIYPGIDLSRFPSDLSRFDLRKKFGISPDEIAVGIAGRLSPVKGHRFFLEAAATFTAGNPQIKIVIAGEDAQITMDDVRVIARKLGIENIITFGRIPNIEELMMSLDIGVVSSIGSEMICRVLLEYYAAGIAVVGTEINQVAEIMKLSSAGLTVPPGNSTAMAEALRKLINNDDLRKRQGEIGRRWIEANGSIDSLGNNTEKFLQKVVNG